MGVDFVMSCYIRKENYEIVEIDQEWVILNTDAYTVTTINELGKYCWTLLNTPQSSSSLYQAIINKYETSINALESDIESFLLELTSCNLIEHAN